MYITARNRDEYEYLVEKRKEFIGEMKYFTEGLDELRPDGTYKIHLGIERVDHVADTMYRYRVRYRKRNKEESES